MLALPFRSPQMLAAAQPLPLISPAAAQPPPLGDGTASERAHVPPRCHAVYRELGGVPIPPNLRPASRAGTAPCKGLPQPRRPSGP